MSTYRQIHGKAVKSLDTDPSATTDAGQIWYNTSSETFKSIVNVEAWASAAPTINALYRRSSAGPTTAAFLAGGDSGPGPSVSNLTEEWDGSGFSVGGTLNTGRYSAGGAGTLTAGLAFGGGTNPTPPNYQTATESYNGTSWTSSPNGLNTARFVTQGVGTTTAALCMGGLKSPSNTAANNSEEWGGTSWTAGNTLNTARESAAQAGIQTAALLAGGYSTTYSAATESYDGTTWTSVNSMNTARFSLGGAGTQTSAIAYGGDKNPSTVVGATETWDGTDWTTSPATMATARMHPGDFGSSTNAFAAAGGTPTVTNVTEEFNSSANVITAGAWASGGNLNTARYSLGGFGTATAGVAMCGRDSPIYQATEEYDGNAWTTVNNYPQTVNDLGSTGVLTAGLGLGGLNPPSIPSWPTTGRVTGEYDGTNWTTGGSYTYDAWGTECAGTQTATVASGGHNYPMPPGNISSSAEYDGSSWTAGNSMSQARALFASSGSQTAAVVTGGRSSPGVEDPTNKTEEYDGTNWTSGGNYVISVKENTQGGGPQTAAYMAGGSAPPYTTVAGHYDGTAWATAPSLPTVKGLGNAASNTADNTTGLVFGGAAPSTTNSTFNFTAETSAINVKTLTQS